MPQRRTAGGVVTTSTGETAKDVHGIGTVAVEHGSLELDDASDTEMSPLSSEDNNDKHSRNQAERHELRLKQWRESAFAIGLTEPTWLAERDRPCRKSRAHGDGDLEPDDSGCLCVSARVCPFFGAERVGNMAVLKSSHEWVEEVTEDEETGKQTVRRYKRPKLDILVGPYWPMLVFVTYPLILGVSGWTLWAGILPGGKPVLLVLLWVICTVGLIVALACTGFRDPGIMYKHKEPPPQGENLWRWTDDALTYRPQGAFYDRDTAVVVEGFDHTYVVKSCATT
jgi:hypothetical protein